MLQKRRVRDQQFFLNMPSINVDNILKPNFYHLSLEVIQRTHRELRILEHFHAS